MTPSISADNLSGLVVGEGCFYAESAADRNYRLGWRIRPGFCVEMRADDREVLGALRLAMDCGEIYELDFGRYRGYEQKGWHPHAKFRVTRIRDLHEKVVPFFELHPLFGRKRKAFDLFAPLVGLVYAREHLTPAGLKSAKQIASRLAQHNARGLHS